MICCKRLQLLPCSKTTCIWFYHHHVAQTLLRQVAAHALGLPLGAVYIAETATDKVPNASSTAASASSDLYGGAGARMLRGICPDGLSYVSSVVAGFSCTSACLPRQVSFEEPS